MIQALMPVLTIDNMRAALLWMLLLPLIGGVFNGFLSQCLQRPSVRNLSGIIGCACIGLSFVCALIIGVYLQQHPALVVDTTCFAWMHAASLQLDVRFVVDRLAALMVLLITGVGSLIHIYSLGYMAHEPAIARYFAYLNLFIAAMLVLVLADSLPLMFVGWEGVGLFSYLLVGFWYSDNDKASAGKKAFIINRIGDCGLLLAMQLLLQQVGSLQFVQLERAANMGRIDVVILTIVCFALLFAVTGKSAQIPLYVWLPDAMKGPTPVSALIHAATMVTAGIYLIARLHFLWIHVPSVMFATALLGAITALFAASVATVQNDIKKVLAYSTISQLGLMLIATGVGAYSTAMLHVVTHGFFKACLFLGAGSVIHSMGGEQDMRHMGHLSTKMPVTCMTFVVSTLAITGLPFFSGFISKDAILAQAFVSHQYGVLLWGMALAVTLLTSFYMWRVVFLVFFSGASRFDKTVHESARSMTVPMMLLAFLACVGGALGWPHVFGGHVWIDTWLAPVLGYPPIVDLSTAQEMILMLLATMGALLGLLMAWLLYGRKIHPIARRLVSESPWCLLYDRLLAALHVDACYDLVIAKPLVWLSEWLLYEMIERRLIGGAINMCTWLVRSIGFLGQLLQNGNIQRYLAIFVIALVWFGLKFSHSLIWK